MVVESCRQDFFIGEVAGEGRVEFLIFADDLDAVLVLLFRRGAVHAGEVAVDCHGWRSGGVSAWVGAGEGRGGR